MDGERILKNQTIIIRGGVIEQVGENGEIEIPAGALVIDGHDRYLMPGLVDMHGHVKDANELLLSVANGVTSVRNLWGGEGAVRWMGFPDHLQMRAEIENGALLGPALVTSGPIMEGPPARMPLMSVFSNPAAAAESVARQKGQGYDFVKVYDNLELDVYQAIVAAAQEQQIQVVGHVPRQVGLDAVLASGQLTIEHLTGTIDPDTAELLVPEERLPRSTQPARSAAAPAGQHRTLLAPTGHRAQVASVSLQSLRRAVKLFDFTQDTRHRHTVCPDPAPPTLMLAHDQGQVHAVDDGSGAPHCVLEHVVRAPIPIADVGPVGDVEGQ